jgi:hypothetical protein
MDSAARRWLRGVGRAVSAVAVSGVMCAAVTCGAASAAFGQSGEPSPDPTVAPEATTTSTPPSSVAPTTTTTLAKCDATADIAVSFVGNPKTRVGSKVVFNVKSVTAGQIPDSTVEVDFPRDDRFLFDQDLYSVAASFDVEAKSYVSKVRPLPDTPKRCFALDPIVTKHADGSAIDTGLLDGMKGNWKRVPVAFLLPMGVVVGVLTVLVALRRTSWWIARRTVGEWLANRRANRA